MILTNRDLNSWHKSIIHTVEAIKPSRLDLFIGFFFKSETWRHQSMISMMWDRVVGSDLPKNGKAWFTQHYAHVRRLMADRPQDLLEYEVKQGWTPLCEFLNKPIPPQDFPRTNDSASFQVKISAVTKQRGEQAAKALIIMLVSFGVLGGAVFWALKMSS